MIMVYKDIMTPIEMLSNFDRLPVQTSSIYEPYLEFSFIVYSNNTPEYSDYIESRINFQYENINQMKGFSTSDRLKIVELASDPIPVCQFHKIEVFLNYVNILETMKYYGKHFNYSSFIFFSRYIQNFFNL